MTAAAGAARSATALTDHAVSHATAWGLLVVVLGGLVEGTALGWLQARALDTILGPTGRRHWVLVTVLVAGLGWAAASRPPPSPATRPVSAAAAPRAPGCRRSRWRDGRRARSRTGRRP